jgi:hypothetical protein
MSTMLQEALLDHPNVHRFYHFTMLTHFPKLNPHIYEHVQ